MKLEVGKIYKTRNSKLLVEIIDYDSDRSYPCKGTILNQSPDETRPYPYVNLDRSITYRADGNYFENEEYDIDLVVEITDPVILAFYQK